MKKPLIIFGTAEIAELATFYFTHDSEYEVIAYTIDGEYIESDTFLSLPVIPFDQVKDIYPPEKYSMHVALSYMKLNQLREAKYLQAKEAGYELANYISSKATTWPDISVGDNVFILEDQTIQPIVKIGNNVMLWSGNHIGHGTQIQDHVYIASHAVISGHCNIGKRCFIGVNATVKDFIEIGADCFIAMDASVTKNLTGGSVVLGAPSNILEESDRRAKILKKIYFKL